MEKLEKYGIAPKILASNDALFLLKVEDVGKVLSKVSKFDFNNLDYKHQLNYIRESLKKENIVHGDIHLNNFCVKNDKLYILDFEYANEDDTGTCRNVPKYEGKKKFSEYLNENKCLTNTAQCDKNSEAHFRRMESYCSL
jgi:tRNA A-37 threonylcarbamoyl transferase component Bud32